MNIETTGDVKKKKKNSEQKSYSTKEAKIDSLLNRRDVGVKGQ